MEQKQLAKIKGEAQHRAFTVSIGNDIDEENRTVAVAFSSEEPYLRFFGYEILDHRSESVRLGRLTDGGAVLVDHDTRDHVGVVESVKIDGDRVGRAVLRFGRSARAQEVFTDVVDGIRKSISVGYRILDMELEKSGDDQEPVYRVTDWEPFEISFVAVPADSSVGVGRSDTNTEIPIMDKQDPTPAVPAPVAPAVVTPEIDVRQVQADARKEELSRIREITAIGNSFPGKLDNARELIDAAIDENTGIDAFRKTVLAELQKQNNAAPGDVPEIGLSKKEAKQFSFTRVMAALAVPENTALRKAAAFELEVSDEAQRASGRSSLGFMVPPEVMKRDLNVGTPTAGGNTVETELRGMIEILRNSLATANAGATILSGLEGNVTFPRQTGSATGYWIAEGGTPTESQQTIDQVALSPKTVGAYTEYTRQMLLQSSIDVETFVRNDLAAILARAIDLAALYGSGASNEPLGVANQVGINAPTNFAAPMPTFAEVVAMETALAEDNANSGNRRYISRTNMVGHFKTTEKFASTGMTIYEQGGTVNGYGLVASNQVTDGDLFFANWSELLMGMWGGLDVMVNPYALDTAGGVRISALQSMDIAVRHPVSFAFNNDGV